MSDHPQASSRRKKVHFDEQLQIIPISEDPGQSDYKAIIDALKLLALHEGLPLEIRKVIEVAVSATKPADKKIEEVATKTEETVSEYELKQIAYILSYMPEATIEVLKILLINSNEPIVIENVLRHNSFNIKAFTKLDFKLMLKNNRLDIIKVMLQKYELPIDIFTLIVKSEHFFR